MAPTETLLERLLVWVRQQTAPVSRHQVVEWLNTHAKDDRDFHDAHRALELGKWAPLAGPMKLENVVPWVEAAIDALPF